MFATYDTSSRQETDQHSQYNELAKLLGKSTTDTPPLSLASITPTCPKNAEQPLSAFDILELRNEHHAAQKLRAAIDATSKFWNLRRQTTNGVKIWSGPSADTAAPPVKLPSITESPMEQDFTVFGVPSKLGCPFASMAGKKLSTHAASVLSRYNGSHSPRDGQSVIRDGSAIGSSVSRLNGRDSIQKSRRHSALVDPIKADICGLDSHESKDLANLEGSQIEDADVPKEGEPGVCPIRFLNQHSPEELAQYFEKHKHELPRSHEVCVRKYQSNEQQVRELDAKYSDVAQMIRGLGEKHQSYLPKEPEDEEDVVQDPQHGHNPLDEGRVEKWAHNVSPSVDAEPQLNDDEGREPHFSRPLRDVRLGESPSRPWGIQIPAQYLEEAGSDASSAPVQIKSSGAFPEGHPGISQAELSKGARCPFAGISKLDDKPKSRVDMKAADVKDAAIAPASAQAQSKAIQDALRESTDKTIVFNGPVIIGYGPEEAARFLQSLAMRQPQ